MNLTSLYKGTANHDLMEMVNAIAREIANDEPFYVANLGDVLTKYRIWKTKLPRVNPYYAVKTNCDVQILRLMASLGFGFDCASKEEIEMALAAGAKPADIIYAHPFKFQTHLEVAKSKNINLLTFDTECELLKIKRVHPKAKLLLRFRVHDVSADIPLNNKFGCEFEECHHLLKVAKKLKLKVIGTCCHVGGLCKEPMAYSRAIKMARDIFDIASDLGFEFRLLDLGGGFSGDSNCYGLFNKICYYINASLDEHFPKDKNITIMAEPGCYFACSAFTLCTTIIGKKKFTIQDEKGTSEKIMYYLNDGIYGSFPYMFDHYGVRMNTLLNVTELETRPEKPSKLWGCTCCSLDCIVEDCQLPEMNIGERLVFENMGAYTITIASTFNGFPKPKVRYVFSRGSKRVNEFQLHDGGVVKSMRMDDLEIFIDPRSCTAEEEDDSNCDLCSFG